MANESARTPAGTPTGAPTGAAAAVDVARLVEEHHQAVFAYAYRLCGRVVDAEDLTQQAFLVAQQRLGQLREPGRARSWLFSIARNTFFKGRQKRIPEPAANLSLDIDSFPAEPAHELEIDPRQLQEAIDELGEGFRVVLVMFYFEDCSYREIAEELDLPIGTVMSRLARAKRQLRSKLFEPKQPEPPRRQPTGVR